jgi:hypothetical protein
MSRNRLLWLAWLAMTIPAAAFLFATMVYGGNRGMLLIGETTSGHHQIELACDACHSELFGDQEVLQDACVNCHGGELKQANDSHPKSKFTDPRNADRTAKLDARYCVTCHREHKPDITNAMGVTLPDDYCFVCHEDIAEERPSHEGLAFDSCATAGCHNFHDNRALYEDFFEKHRDQPANLSLQRVAFFDWQPPKPEKPKPPLSLDDAQGPDEHLQDPALLADWADDAHAAAGVNCAGCHARKTEPDIWIKKPAESVCARCHDAEGSSFVEGKHGLRLRDDLFVSHDGLFGWSKAEPLAAMTPADARLPMKADASDRTLGCNSCHGAHDFDRRKAAVEACLGCHDDEHSKAYEASPHSRLWQAEMAGDAPEGSGVSCASCHMPRIEVESAYGESRVVATHNQNLTLQPNEKMIRPVCLSCHGLAFAIDALADFELIASNFTGQPSGHVPSMDWVVERIEARAKERGDKSDEDDVMPQ